MNKNSLRRFANQLMEAFGQWYLKRLGQNFMDVINIFKEGTIDQHLKT